MRALPFVIVLLTACSGPGVFVAENGEHRLVARDEQTGVTVIITTGVWPGDPEFARDATIIHTLVANNGNQPILLAPGDIELRDIRGFQATLLDTGATFDRVTSEEGAMAYDRAYERNYDPGTFTEFEQAVVPAEISSQALPWGVLEAGTQMRGFLFFESITRTTNQAKLVWHVTSPDHVPLSDLVFDLYVAR